MNNETKRAYEREWYKANPHRKTNVLARRDRVREENKNLIHDHLSAHPCVDCGNTDIRCLDFDHVRGVKRNNVSVLARQGASSKSVRDEIAKCEVRCANCHRIRHFEERNNAAML